MSWLQGKKCADGRAAIATGNGTEPPSGASASKQCALAERWLLAAVFFQLSCRVEENVTPVLAEVVGRPRPEDLKPLNTRDPKNLENLKS